MKGDSCISTATSKKSGELSKDVPEGTKGIEKNLAKREKIS